MIDATWFRRPGADHPGTGNAAYDALDRHVVRGRADEVAVEVVGRPWTHAELLAESAAFAGVLRALGTGPGDHVVVGRLPDTESLLVALAGARLGAVLRYVDDPGAAVAEAAARVVVAATDPVFGRDGPAVVTVDDTGELVWSEMMRAGRTDPAACESVPGDGVLAVVGERAWTLADALGATADPAPVPDGVDLVSVGGVRLWSWRARD